MSDTATLFDFERDFSAALQCIPMAVRFKLDHSGVKLSLKQWSRFSQADRGRLLQLPCASTTEVAHYRDVLVALITASAVGEVKEMDIPHSPPWLDDKVVPEQVLGYAQTLGVPPPTVAQWQALSPLRRFVLLKLSRPSHDNVNFIPALREFHLLPPAA